MTTERFMVDDCGTLIDLHTRDTFDYVSDVCELLNVLHSRNKRLEYKIQRERTSFTKIHEKWSREAENKIKELSNENEQLKKEAEEYNEDAMSYQTLYEQQLEKFEKLLSECKHQQEQKMKFYKENERLRSENSDLHQKLFEQRTINALERTEISKQPYKTSKEFLDEIEKW